MKYAMALALFVGSIGTAAAQDIPSITVRPYADGGAGQGYVGPYGRNLPGVAMLSGRAASFTNLAAFGGVPVPSRQKIENEASYNPSRLPILDGYQGTLSDGFPF
ncbi:hypothetical protein L1787_11050 [Acuticoccus sp. M5D2P5]|uniref:hypothetical protein n=1 Tax=Acuticoccus kalidii TaxID=2910977 RepID=UPI001F43637C|nr:hypothetical protein [Acuticoccus kalidii]MCF3933954.1 hypothetical protein [Acuticoccus kalidii]